MVIHVIVEGGVIGVDPTLKASQNFMIQQNSAALRESLNKFFTQALNNDNVDIRISVGAGWKDAAKSFVKNQEHDYLYVDLDRPPEKRNEWFNQDLFSDGSIFPEDKIDSVFFWIQEMEAWFLKQPECIEKWALHERVVIKNNAKISDDRLIKGKDIEHLIQKPSDVMKFIFNRYLLSSKADRNGKPRKVIYGKLRHAPWLIRYLDPQRMVMQDKELCNFINKVTR